MPWNTAVPSSAPAHLCFAVTYPRPARTPAFPSCHGIRQFRPRPPRITVSPGHVHAPRAHLRFRHVMEYDSSVHAPRASLFRRDMSTPRAHTCVSVMPWNTTVPSTARAHLCFAGTSPRPARTSALPSCHGIRLFHPWPPRTTAKHSRIFLSLPAMGIDFPSHIHTTPSYPSHLYHATYCSIPSPQIAPLLLNHILPPS